MELTMDETKGNVRNKYKKIISWVMAMSLFWQPVLAHSKDSKSIKESSIKDIIVTIKEWNQALISIKDDITNLNNEIKDRLKDKIKDFKLSELGSLSFNQIPSLFSSGDPYSDIINKIVNLEKKAQNIFNDIKTTDKYNEIIKRIDRIKMKSEELKMKAASIAPILLNHIRLEKIDPKERFIKLIDFISDYIKSLKRIRMALQLRNKSILNRDFLPNGPIDYHYSILKEGTSGKILQVEILNPEEPNPIVSLLVRFEFPKNIEVNEGAESGSQDPIIEDLWVEIESEPGLVSNSLYEIKNSAGRVLNINAPINELFVKELNSATITVKNGLTGIAYSKSANDELDSTLEGLKDNNEIELSSQESSAENNSTINQDKTTINRKISSENNNKLLDHSLIKLNDRTLWSPNCYNFIDNRGNYGPWAKAIQKSFTEGGNFDGAGISKSASWLVGEYSSQIGDLDRGIKINTKFKNYSQQNKIDFFIYYAAAVAMTESTCRPTQAAKGPNGTAIGLWQLHKGRTNNYADNVCGNFNETNGSLNVVCGLKMLNYYVKSNKNSDNKLFWDGNYWETMHMKRPSGKKTYGLIKKYENAVDSSDN